MMGELSAVEGLCRTFSDVRRGAGGRIDPARVTSYGRLLSEACQADVRANDGYDPEADNRVLWAREVLASARRGEPVSRARAELEATLDFLLGGPPRELCGKELAAGGDR